ncbi:MAG: hypothetical protein ACI9OE_002835, partial [Mariniflexile sp.]
ALGIVAESPQRGTSPDLQRIARPDRVTPKFLIVLIIVIFKWPFFIV